MAQKPNSFLNWIPNASASNNLAQPPLALSQSGYTAGQPLEAQYLNYTFNLLDQWIQALASGEQAVSQATALNQAMRLYGGGTLSYSASNQLLSWSGPITIAIPSCQDTDNQIAAGSIMVPSGSVAYVNANVPITTQGTWASGATVIEDVVSVSGIVTGMSVTGAGIASGTTVSGVSNGQVNLSTATTSAGNAANVSFASTGSLSIQTAQSASFVPSANSIVIARGVGIAISVGVGETEFWLRDQESRTLLNEGYVASTFAPAGQTVVPGQAVYLSSGAADGRTQGSLYPTDASVTNATTRSACIGFITTPTLSGNLAYVVSSGVVSGFTSLTPGATYYLDPNNVGGITSAMTSTLGQALMSVGVALSSTTLLAHMGRSQIVSNTFSNGAVVTGNVTATGGMSNNFGFKQTISLGSLTFSSATIGAFYQTVLASYDTAANSAQFIPRWVPIAFNGSVMAISLESTNFQNYFQFVLKARSPGTSLSERVVYQTTAYNTTAVYYDQGVQTLYFPKGQLSINAGDLLSCFVACGSSKQFMVQVSAVIEMESLY